MLTGKIRYRSHDNGLRLVLQVEVHDRPRLVKVGNVYASEKRTSWRDASITDLSELHELALEDAKSAAFGEGFEHALEQQGAVAKADKKDVH